MPNFTTIPTELRLKIYRLSLPSRLVVTPSAISVACDKNNYCVSIYKVTNPLLPLLLINRRAHAEVLTIPPPIISLHVSDEDLNPLLKMLNVPSKELPSHVKVTGHYKGTLESPSNMNTREVEQRRLEIILLKRFGSVECQYRRFGKGKEDGDPYGRFEMGFDVAHATALEASTESSDTVVHSETPWNVWKAGPEASDLNWTYFRSHQGFAAFRRA